MADFADRDNDFDDLPPELGGHVLIAHPGIDDPHFARSVVLLSAHSEHMGAVGVVVNQPLQTVLAYHDPDFAFGALADVPLFKGGPVAEEQLILIGWRWVEEQASFEIYFAIDSDKAIELLREFPDLQLRAFVGCAGWSAGQLEGELEQGGWAVLPLRDTRLYDMPPEMLWRTYALEAVPEWVLLVDSPEDPSFN